MGWKLNSCCCCFELKTGVVVIGILGLIEQLMFLTAPFSSNNEACNTYYMKNCFELSSRETAGITIWNVINIMLTLMMIYGSENNQPALIFPAIIVSIIGLILYLGLIWAGSIVAFKNDVAEVGIVMLIVGHLVWAFTSYFFMVIYNR
ncbi:uncharacterized protein LOC123270487 [Cotesia glomerata]|uniref:uncharacterized protein LOC123270487 n=1 Tax=Cotesia glomerata TaxID=32391 RepID=UPI001D02F17C|nr:uncharacterized protein LOC123270487 [Cotesia glomerata]